MRKKTSWILPAVFALLVLVVMILIYYFSSENGLQSTATSNGVTKWVVKIIKPDFDSMEKADRTAYFSLVAHYVRKAAHFSEYTAMGLLFTLCAYSFNRLQPYRYTPQVLFAGLLTAVADETVQLFADGRAGMLEDVWLDFAGVITGFALMLIFCLLIVRRRKKHEFGNKKGK